MHRLLIFLGAISGWLADEESFASAYRTLDELSYANQTDLGPHRRESIERSTRSKRSLAFPKGSAFVLTMSIVKAIQLREPANWNLDLEFDMIWPIPKGFDAASMRRRRTTSGNAGGWSGTQTAHRRHRRELYSNFQLALDSQGLPGEQCVLRTICETKFLLNPPGMSLVEDLIRVVFSYPASSAFAYDVYDVASVTQNDCGVMYPCPLSLLHLLLNYNDDLSLAT